METTKLFISHASEDKEDFVEPLVHALRDIGYDVWYDKLMLTMGDSLLGKISEGLKQCDFGIVVLSQHFFSKDWPQEELDGLFSLQTEARKVILPIWKDVTKADVQAFSPILAGKLAALASNGVPAVVDDIRRAVETTRTVKKFSAVENVRSKFQMLDKRVSGSKQAQALCSSEEGVQIAYKAVDSIVETLKKQLEEIGQSSATMKFQIDPKNVTRGLTVWCPYRLKLWFHYHHSYINSLTGAGLMVYIAHSKSGYIDDSTERDVIQKHILSPSFDHTLKLVWKDTAKSFTTEQIVPFILELLVEEVSKLHAESEANKQL